jgi:hypothetical protein
MGRIGCLRAGCENGAALRRIRREGGCCEMEILIKQEMNNER